MGFRRRYKNFVEKFLAGEQGGRFFHICYNVGAAIVIIGALAKINHWPWGLGTYLIGIGLLVEAFIFFIAAFDKPARDWKWDRVFPVLDTGEEQDRPGFNGGGGGATISGGSGSGTVIINGAAGPQSNVEAVSNMSQGEVRKSFGIPNAVDISEEDSNALTASIKKMAAAADQLERMAEMTEATQQYLDKLTLMADNMDKFSSVTNSLTDVSDILLNSYKSITDNSDGINDSSRGYVNQMESLNRNIQGLNTIYEIQLKSVSSQIDAIERINSGLMRIKDMYESSVVDSSVFRTENERMAQQLQSLNGVYSRLLNAMTINMHGNPYMGGQNPESK